MKADPVVWALRAAAILDVLWLWMVFLRSLRGQRAAQFNARPSTAQGLAGRWLARTSLVVLAPDGRVASWVERVAYPRRRLDLVVVLPPGVEPVDVPAWATIVTAGAATRAAMLDAGAAGAAGDVLVFVPAGHAVGRGFVKRMVAPLVDPWAGAAVARVLAGNPDGLAGAVDDLDRLARAALQLGRHVIGAPVTSEAEPIALRRHVLEDIGGWDPTHPAPETDVAMRLYLRGYVIVFVQEALALAAPATWTRLSRAAGERVAGLRRAWRVTRPLVRRTKVLDGIEKTDVRWLTRGASAPLWLLAGWTLVAVLRLADTSWAPEAIGGVLLLASFSTLRMVPFVTVSTAAVQSGRLRALALEPWLAPLSLATMWQGAGAAVAAAFRRLPASPAQARLFREGREDEYPAASEPEPEPVPVGEAEPVVQAAAEQTPEPVTGPPPERRRRQRTPPPPKRRGPGVWETRE